MPKILVNYKYNKKSDTYILRNSDVVFADLPVAEMELDAEYEDILVVPLNGRMTVVDKEEYLKINSLFKLSAWPDGTVHLDDQNGSPVWLPKNTDIDKLRFINGQLVLVSEEETQETQETEIEKEGE